MQDISRTELMITAISRLLSDCRHIAVGVLSPIPGSAALLTRAHNDAKVSIIGCDLPEFRTDGGVDLFDCAGQGRLDAFFLSGGQIDGQANINLNGLGAYPEMDTRWSGAFGSAYLYFMVPRVILFKEEHTRRVFVPRVDFISAPGTSAPNVFRPGGPHALVTGLCVMHFSRKQSRFRLASVHPGFSVEEVRDNTGFDFDIPETVPITQLPDNETLSLIRGDVARTIATTYPAFASSQFNVMQGSAIQ